MNEKITPRHLERRAIVYIRQSSQQQVLYHKEGQRMQYAMEQKVRDLGWMETEIIDEDMGRSAATVVGRSGFERMVAEVCLGKVGAVAAIEVSRFARNNRDWHQLIEMCGTVDTLLIDHETVYDPRRANDRLLLGLKGSMSEYELDLLRQRSLEARWAKARRGELVVQAPIGFIKTSAQRLEIDPDLRVQHSINLVFAKFLEFGSARQVAMWLIEHGIDVPAKRYGPSGWQTWWRRPAYRNVLDLLREPVYAGAYAYGKTTSKAQVREGVLQKTIARKPLNEWTVLIPNHHCGYIDWEQYLRIQKMLNSNAASFNNIGRTGASKKGPALLAGLMRCRRCGRKLMVGYCGKNAVIPRYECYRGRLDNMERKCISFGGLTVDNAVANEILRVVRPCAIDAAVLAVTQENQQRDELIDTMLLELKAARYTAQLACRQYEAADPDNRLVTAELERRWNVALEKVSQIEARVEREQNQGNRDRPDASILRSLGLDLDRVWHSPDVDIRLKKRIIRTLIEEILVDIDAERNEVDLVIHWKGGIHSTLRVARRRRGDGSPLRTSPDIVEAIRQLALICDDDRIAGYLNRNGMLTARGNRWCRMAVAGHRSKRGISVYSKERQLTEGWINLTEAAAHLRITAKTMRRIAEAGEVKAMHPLEDGPWVFKRADLDSADFRKCLEHRLSGNTQAAGPNFKQLALGISTTYRGEVL